MPDREKVIKGLEVCTKPGTRGCFYDIKECPYDENGCRMAMMRDALALLKEQEAVEPKHNPLSPTDWFCADGERRTE